MAKKIADKKVVLLVDDDAAFVETNKAVLEQNGYEVAAAYNGKEGLDKARTMKPDLIVLDVIMTTHSDGFDVSRLLRESPETKNIPLLMVTSVNETVPFKFEPNPTWLPVDQFVEKPITPGFLLEKVNAILRRGASGG